MVVCLERGAVLHMAQLMSLPLTISCSSKIQIGFTFLVPAHPGSPGKSAVKRVCVCVCVCRPGPNVNDSYSSTATHTVYSDEWVCLFVRLSVCLRTYLQSCMSDLHQIFEQVTYSCGSISFLRRRDTLCNSDFTADVTKTVLIIIRM